MKRCKYEYSAYVNRAVQEYRLSMAKIIESSLNLMETEIEIQSIVPILVYALSDSYNEHLFRYFAETHLSQENNIFFINW